MNNVETEKLTVSETVSGENADVVAEEEEIAGEVVEETIETEIMVGEGLIAEGLDTQDHHADVTPEIEDRSAHLHRESRIHTSPVAVVGADEMTEEDHRHRNPHLLPLPGPILSRVHHLLAVEIGPPRDLAHQRLEDADPGRQIAVAPHIGEEEVEAEEEVRIVEPVEGRQLLRPPFLVLHAQPKEEDPLPLHP